MTKATSSPERPAKSTKALCAVINVRGGLQTAAPRLVLAQPLPRSVEGILVVVVEWQQDLDQIHARNPQRGPEGAVRQCRTYRAQSVTGASSGGGARLDSSRISPACEPAR